MVETEVSTLLEKDQLEESEELELVLVTVLGVYPPLDWLTELLELVEVLAETSLKESLAEELDVWVEVEIPMELILDEDSLELLDEVSLELLDEVSLKLLDEETLELVDEEILIGALLLEVEEVWVDELESLDGYEVTVTVLKYEELPVDVKDL